jgi:hypothetical protein
MSHNPGNRPRWPKEILCLTNGLTFRSEFADRHNWTLARLIGGIEAREGVAKSRESLVQKAPFLVRLMLRAVPSCTSARGMASLL